MTLRDITTGEQAVTTAAAITGSLDTSALVAGDFKTIKLTVRGLAAGKRALFAIEDTASGSAFSDKVQIAVAHFVGTQPTEGVAREWQTADVPLTRFGVSNSALRLYCLAIDGTPGTVKAHAWLE